MTDDTRHSGQHEKDSTTTATGEVLEELKEQGREEDTDTSKGRGAGGGDPVSPSPGANEDAVEGH
ncbi:hypothetical protein [Streptomyces beigongshangae]|uniref:hypothetical protein n=1 Tax=Streptomyces beigongshangae TaxID=2841597 RepID=UPI001C86405C|nr:hypothetical protein [Streptomyces sp. REN17]